MNVTYLRGRFLRETTMKKPAKFVETYYPFYQKLMKGGNPYHDSSGHWTSKAKAVGVGYGDAVLGGVGLGGSVDPPETGGVANSGLVQPTADLSSDTKPGLYVIPAQLVPQPPRFVNNLVYDGPDARYTGESLNLLVDMGIKKGTPIREEVLNGFKPTTNKALLGLDRQVRDDVIALNLQLEKEGKDTIKIPIYFPRMTSLGTYTVSEGGPLEALATASVYGMSVSIPPAGDKLIGHVYPHAGNYYEVMAMNLMAEFESLPDALKKTSTGTTTKVVFLQVADTEGDAALSKKYGEDFHTLADSRTLDDGTCEITVWGTGNGREAGTLSKGSLAHELAHSLDGSDDKISSGQKYTQAVKSDTMKVSKYASDSSRVFAGTTKVNSEDFADSVSLWVEDRSGFTELCPARAKFIDSIMV